MVRVYNEKHYFSKIKVSESSIINTILSYSSNTTAKHLNMGSKQLSASKNILFV